ncbi:hypothetical protein [Priestia aryabhattai]
MLSKETIEGMNSRIKTSNPMWMLVGGPDLAHLSPYRDKISLMIFTDMFYKELNGNGNRTKEDLNIISYSVIKQMNLNPTKELAEKVVDALMWSEGKGFARFSFVAQTFNEESEEWEEQRFQYFTLDREYSDLENGREVFKLTEESQELVLKSQELLDELDINIQGIISEMLIKRGKFKEALSSLQNLDTKVKRLILKEEEHKKQIIKDPKGAIYTEYKKWGENLEEVRVQFKEELERYDEMERVLKHRLETEKNNSDITKLFYRISITRREHDKLARLVIGNIQKEFKFRSDPNLFTLLWSPPKSNFRTTVMEEHAVPKGFQDPKDAFTLMNVLFSPQNKFIYPMQWMVREQGNRGKIIDFDNSRLDNDDDNELYQLDVDWEEVVELWTPIMSELLTKGEVSVTYLLTLSEPILHRWLKCREAFDLWVQFAMRGQLFEIPEIIPDVTKDQKMHLIGKVIENDVQLRNLLGTNIEVTILNRKLIRIENEIEISPIRLSLIS